MDFLRQIVGGPKKRYRENGYNLDLTYITPRIVAMAFPASGIQKLYRNSIDTIAQFLKNQHKNKYLTVNISGRSINEQVLQNVISFDWQDHKSPPFDTLFVICDKVAQFLKEDGQRIAVFHCNHGKGRTGTIICCFFLYMGLFSNQKQVIQFYGSKRFQKQGYGVNQPCQVQYILYFNKYLKNSLIQPKVLRIKKITFRGGFSIDNPYIKLFNMQEQKAIYNTKQQGSSLEIQKSNQYIISFTKKHYFVDDMVLDIKQNKSIGKNLLISYVFNTTFIQLDNPLVIKLQKLSPLGKQKQACFQKDFQMEIQFRKVCDCTLSSQMQCKKCNNILKNKREKWQRIKQIYEKRNFLLDKRKLICFGSQQQYQ